MRPNGALVQLPTRRDVATVWVPVVDDPDGIDDGTEGAVLPITVHLSERDAEFLERYAAYRNKLAEARGEKLKAQFSRKSMGEKLLAAQIKAIRDSLREMMKELGELPPKKAPDALKYAKRAKDFISNKRS